MKVLTRLSVCFLWLLALCGIAQYTGCSPEKSERRVLVFSKTEGYRHDDAIQAGKFALLKMGVENGFLVDTTEDAAAIEEVNLKKYKAVVLLNISGAVFSPARRLSLKRFVQAGGGVLATHATADAERDWPWFGQMIGAYFDTHPPVQKGLFITTDKDHPGSSFLPDSLYRTDEFYNFSTLSPDIRVLVRLDEGSYSGGKMGAMHPAVWCQEFDGGRSFYTSWGHNKQSWQEPLVLQQIAGGLRWVLDAANGKKLDYTKAIPEDNRFEREVLMEKMDEPIQMSILKTNNVIVAQRRGGIQLYDARTNSSRLAGTIPVLSAYEDGLLGIAADPGFETNGQVYVFYAAPGIKDSVSDYRISRFTITESRLDLKSEKILIRIPHQNADGIHTGGGMMFDPRGTGDLFITVGDNTSPRATLYAPLDEQPGRELFNAQRSASNTNDLRGKILRIHPEASGTYTIPGGNLFPEGTAHTRPEIYSMGHRQPWRLSMDTKTGWLYEGEVGPDASVDSTGRGPMAYDEFNQIRKPGNFGWPYFGGNNQPYNEFDFATGLSGGLFDPAKPVNKSRLNTGLTQLPPAQGSLVWYSNTTPKEFPLMGHGARSAMGGPLFRKADYRNTDTHFPDYYEGKWFVTEWIRDWIMVISMDEQGNYKSMERFLPDMAFAGPMDMQFGPDGSLYVLEYGKGWFRQNNDSKLVKIKYNNGNRKPLATIVADRVNGSVPFTAKLSAKDSRDADNDKLSFEWIITSQDGTARSFTGTEQEVAFSKPGLYRAALVVKDARGATCKAEIEISAGNEIPELKIELVKGNSSFFFDSAVLEYKVSASDKEDGSLAGGQISAADISVNMNYSAEGFSYSLPGQPTAEQRGIGIKGGMIINSNDCYHCHSISVKSIGPTFTEIAERYKNDNKATERLADKVIKGGAGEWGTVSMSAHPELSVDDSKRMISFILNLAQAPPKSLPVSGKHMIRLPERLSNRGVYVLHASYKDKGANGIASLTGEHAIVLAPSWILPSKANLRYKSVNVKVPNPRGEIEILKGRGAYIAYRQIDLAEIKKIEVYGEGNGVLEIRLDSSTGKILGSVNAATMKSADPLKNNPVANISIEATKGKHDLFFVLNGKGFNIKNYIRFYP